MRPETEFSAMHRDRAAAKRQVRRARNRRVQWRSGYVYTKQELVP